jgi:hypothetical protein
MSKSDVDEDAPPAPDRSFALRVATARPALGPGQWNLDIKGIA